MNGALITLLLLAIAMTALAVIAGRQSQGRRDAPKAIPMNLSQYRHALKCAEAGMAVSFLALYSIVLWLLFFVLATGKALLT